MMRELPLVGDEFAGYRVRGVLGRGGMSVVYQAENLRLNNVIALKVLAPELAADDVFRARYRAACSVSMSASAVSMACPFWSCVAAPGELAGYCLHALTAAGSLPSEAAVRRLLAVTMSGLRPQPAS